MRTIPEIESEIAGLIALIGDKKDAKKPYIKENARIAFLRHVVLYLETGPTESYVQRECQRLDKLIDSLESQFETWCKNTPPDAPPAKYKSVFIKEMGLSLLKLQRKTAYFILGHNG